MPSTPITSLPILKSYLQTAIQLEHATIPPYLTALYSIRQGANLDSYNIIRAVVVEEMLHLTLAANLLNAIGGSPSLTTPKFVPDYPTHLPSGADDFEVGLARFSKDTIGTFLNIERPSKPNDDHKHVCYWIDDIAFIRHANLTGGRQLRRGLIPAYTITTDGGETIELHYWSIGDFYKAIKHGFDYLAAQPGGVNALFTGQRARQIGPQYYNSGGGEIIEVTDLKTAHDAIDLISDQGEGSPSHIYDPEGELSHYFRFDQISKQRYYRVNKDEANKPQGPDFPVDFDQVYPVRTNAKIAQYPVDSDVRNHAIDFNARYKTFLQKIETSLNGNPKIIMTAFKDMFEIKTAALRLIHNHIPMEQDHAAPTFEIP